MRKSRSPRSFPDTCCAVNFTFPPTRGPIQETNHEIHRPTNRRRKSLRIARRDEQPCILVCNDVDNPSCRRRNHRLAVSHRFDEHHSKSFSVSRLSYNRREHESIAAREELSNSVWIDDTFERNAVIELEPGRETLKRFVLRAAADYPNIQP